jgi:hypothetical protein
VFCLLIIRARDVTELAQALACLMVPNVVMALPVLAEPLDAGSSATRWQQRRDDLADELNSPLEDTALGRGDASMVMQGRADASMGRPLQVGGLGSLIADAPASQPCEYADNVHYPDCRQRASRQFRMSGKNSKKYKWFCKLCADWVISEDLGVPLTAPTESLDATALSANKERPAHAVGGLGCDRSGFAPFPLHCVCVLSSVVPGMSWSLPRLLHASWFPSELLALPVLTEPLDAGSPAKSWRQREVHRYSDGYVERAASQAWANLQCKDLSATWDRMEKHSCKRKGDTFTGLGYIGWMSVACPQAFFFLRRLECSRAFAWMKSAWSLCVRRPRSRQVQLLASAAAMDVPGLLSPCASPGVESEAADCE